LRISTPWIVLLGIFCVLGVFDTLDTLFYYEDPFPDVAYARSTVWRSPVMVLLRSLILLTVFGYFLLILKRAVRWELEVEDYLKFKMALMAFVILYAINVIWSVVILSFWGSLYEDRNSPSMSFYGIHIFWITVISSFIFKHRGERL
jgi:magnesium-transporting ATPase (P-type)